jgi:hypothetical protein
MNFKPILMETKMMNLQADAELVIEVEKTLKNLQTKHEKWRKQQHMADNMLYVLMEGCLGFYYFLRKSEAYEQAFKSLCCFRWNSKTKTATLIAKAVFGDKAKITYVYAKALEKAVQNNIGTNNEISMLQWLQQNGGINGVIRNKCADESKASSERRHHIEVGRNVHLYSYKKFNISPFINDNLLNKFSDKEFVLVCRADSKSNMIVPKYVTETESLIDPLYEELGKCVVETNDYRERRVEAKETLQKAQNEATKEVVKAMQKISSRVNKAEELSKAA